MLIINKEDYETLLRRVGEAINRSDNANEYEQHMDEEDKRVLEILDKYRKETDNNSNVVTLIDVDIHSYTPKSSDEKVYDVIEAKYVDACF
jgi:hypothetical protein